jgi:hypothetical protein
MTYVCIEGEGHLPGGWWGHWTLFDWTVVVMYLLYLQVVKGGKLMGFRCVAVVGDGKGRVGVGCQAGREVSTAVKRALVDAKKVRKGPFSSFVCMGTASVYGKRNNPRRVWFPL